MTLTPADLAPLARLAVRLVRDVDRWNDHFAFEGYEPSRDAEREISELLETHVKKLHR